MMKYSLLALMLVASVGCLKTRSELAGTENNGAVEAAPEPGRYVAGTLNQQQRAQIDSRFYEIDRDFRQLYGKIEVLEKQVAEGSAKGPSGAPDPAATKKVKDLELRVATLEEAILAIDKKVASSHAHPTLPATHAPTHAHHHGQSKLARARSITFL